MKKNKLNLKKYAKQFLSFAESKPLLTFSVLLGCLVLMIGLGNMLRRPKAETQTAENKKIVKIYKVGSVPKLSISAQIEKSGVVQITAQTSGVVSRINVAEGSKLLPGTPLVALTNSYSGGNAMSLSRQLAEKQNDYNVAVYPMQKDLISKQKDLANQNEANFEKLRDIASQSVSDTQNLIGLNNSIISTLNTNIENLSVDPVGNATLILTSKQLASQFQSANNQLNSALRSTNYQVDTSNPATKLAEGQRDITLKQLDIQEKSLDLSKDVSELQLKLAKVNESLMYPAAPFAGTVERVLVKVGQSVTPGTPLMVISGSKNVHLNAVIYLSKDLAERVSKIEPTVFHVGEKAVSALPSYVSVEAVNGNLYAAIYHLSETEYRGATDKGYVVADLPVGYPDTSVAVPYLPLDTIYQTQDEAYVFVNVDGKVQSKKVEVGNVFGNFVAIKSGLKEGDQIIEDRTVIDGQLVESK